MAATFGEMLMNRRRQMGLSIQQVANTIKIRPQIIEFFETGNFAAMPPRGYAQGMISSYARYLGLNPRQVVEAYFDELRAYEAETAHEGGRFQDPAGYVSSRSSDSQGRFLMVDPPRSRYGQRPPQAGYVTDSTYERARPQGGARRADASRGQRGAAGEPGDGRGRRAAGGQGAFRPRGARPQGGGRAPYGQGRAGQRRPPQRGGRMSQGRPAPGSPRPRGRGGSAASDWLPFAFIGAVAVVLILIAVLAFRGCTSGQAAADDQGSASTLVVNGVDGSTDDSSSTSDDSSGSGSSDDGASQDDAGDSGDASSDAGSSSDDKDAADSKTVVKISVADGESSWLEVRVDGTVVFGNEVPGPWEQEYTVEDSIRITANTPSAVTVTNNGDAVRWDTSTSGVARISITAPKKATDSTTDDAAAGTDGGASSDQDADSAEGGTSTGTSGASTSTGSSSSTTTSTN